MKSVYKDNYHEKFSKMYGKNFTGRCFNPVEFLHHLTNINFHFEVGELMELSDAAIDKIKHKFHFYQYGAYIDGLESDESYGENFKELVALYGKNYGFRNKRKNR